MSEDNLTYKDIYTRVQRKINDTNSTVLTYIKQWIQDRYFEVQNAADWPYMLVPTTIDLTFGPGQYVTDLPFDFREEVSIRDTATDKTFTKDNIKSLSWIRNQDPDNSTTCTVASGTTYIYFPQGRDAKKIAIHPKVDEDETDNMVLKMDYISDGSPLQNDSDIPKIPNRYRVATLVNGAVADYFAFKGDMTKAAMYESKFNSALSSMSRQQGLYEDVGDEEVIRHWHDEDTW